VWEVEKERKHILIFNFRSFQAEFPYENFVINTLNLVSLNKHALKLVYICTRAKQNCAIAFLNSVTMRIRERLRKRKRERDV
jgi:hypothetical protein